MHIVKLLAKFLFAPNIEVIESGLPESRQISDTFCEHEAQLPCRRTASLSPQIPRNPLLQHLQDNRWRGFLAVSVYCNSGILSSVDTVKRKEQRARATRPSVILNRLGEQRAKGRRSTICSIVSAPNQFDAYGGDNYTNCINCTISPKDRKDYDDTLNNFSHAFDMLSDALYFSNNTPALRNYWEKKKDKTRINFPSCPKLAFYTD